MVIHDRRSWVFQWQAPKVFAMYVVTFNSWWDLIWHVLTCPASRLIFFTTNLLVILSCSTLCAALTVHHIVMSTFDPSNDGTTYGCYSTFLSKGPFALTSPEYVTACRITIWAGIELPPKWITCDMHLVVFHTNALHQHTMCKVNAYIHSFVCVCFLYLVFTRVKIYATTA